jgi:hypothetical protein
MRRQWLLFVASAATVVAAKMAFGQELAARGPSPQTFAIETYVARTYN